MIIDVSYISQHEGNVRNNMLGKLQMILGIDGTTASPIIGNLIGRNLTRKKIFIDTLVVQVHGTP